MITRDASTAAVDRAFAPQASARWLIGGAHDETGAGGAIGIVDLDPGGRLPLRRTPDAESVVYVLDGRVGLLTAAGGGEATAGTLLYAPAGAWYGIEARFDAAARLLVALASVNSPSALTWEDGPGAGPGGDRLRGPRPAVLDVAAAEQIEMHDPAGGRHRIRARWLLDADHHATTNLIVGQCSFGPCSVHELHRHPGAAEALYAYRGDAVHLSEAGERPQRPGELVYVPAGEWHGLRGPGGGTLEALFLLFGVSRFDDAGYDLFPAPA